METSYTSPTLISKEEIVNYHFPTQDVLQTADDRIRRKIDLERSTSLGNLEHCKIKIVFEDTTGVKQVETTVWGLTDNAIILKSGVGIPINRIHAVKM